MKEKDIFRKQAQLLKALASEAHLKKVKEVHGEDWPKPFTEMYNYEK